MPRIKVPHLVYVDIVANDRDGNPVLLVEVKAQQEKEGPGGVEQPLKLIRSSRGPHSLFMRVDPDRIILFQFEGRFRTPLYGPQEVGRLDPIARLDSCEVFRHYDPEFGLKPVYGHYLEALVEAWLRDLAYRWNSPDPPGATTLAETGLLEQLEGGTTVSEDVARADPPLP